MNDRQPIAEAVAVRDDRIVAVGRLDAVVAALGGEPYEIDASLSDRVILPGLIDQHLHPILGATTLATEVIATEDWVLPDRTFPAAHSHDEYVRRLRAAVARMSADDPDEWLFSWGYHQLWHGELSRQILDEISPTRPIGVWQRSCHEFYFNTPALESLGLLDRDLAAEVAAGRPRRRRCGVIGRGVRPLLGARCVRPGVPAGHPDAVRARAVRPGSAPDGPLPPPERCDRVQRAGRDSRPRRVGAVRTHPRRR